MNSTSLGKCLDPKGRAINGLDVSYMYSMERFYDIWDGSLDQRKVDGYQAKVLQHQIDTCIFKIIMVNTNTQKKMKKLFKKSILTFWL